MEFRYRYVKDIGGQIELEIIDPNTGEVVNTFVTSEVDRPTGTFKGKPIENFKNQEQAAESKFVYVIKSFGPQKYIVVYEVKQGIETQIFEGQKLIGTTEERLKETAILGLKDKYQGVEKMTSKTPFTPPPSDVRYVYEEVKSGPRIGVKVYKIEKGAENLIYTGELASQSTTTYDQLRQEAINALQTDNPGVDKMSPKDITPGGLKYLYEFKKRGPERSIIVYEVGDGGEKKIYEGAPSFSATEDILREEAVIALQEQYPGVDKMTSKTPTPTPGPKYVYEFKDLGFEKAIVVYEVRGTSETQIYEGPPSLTAEDDTLRREAISALRDTYQGIDGMTPKSVPPPPPPPPTPPSDPPVPKKNTELPYYMPKSRFSEPLSTSGNEYVIKDTGEPYTGFYIETYKGTYFAGKTPEENGAEIVLAEENPGLVDRFNVSFSLLQNLAISFIPTLSGLQKLLGKATRHFVQDKKTGKITETDEETAQQISEQIPGNLPNYRVASVEWVTKGPAEDKVINGYPYEGAASKNKKAIEALEKQMPGISSIVTNYADLVEDPVGRKTTAVDTKKVEEKPLTDQLGNLRKASFDTRA